eukprot:309684-Amphidinium_carterae.2
MRLDYTVTRVVFQAFPAAALKRMTSSSVDMSARASAAESYLRCNSPIAEDAETAEYCHITNPSKSILKSKVRKLQQQTCATCPTYTKGNRKASVPVLTVWARMMGCG